MNTPPTGQNINNGEGGKRERNRDNYRVLTHFAGEQEQERGNRHHSRLEDGCVQLSV